MKAIPLGSIVRDRITGFSGAVTGAAQYITGCQQVLVQPSMKNDEDFREPRWFDVDRLTILAQEPVSIPVTVPGPDIAAPSK